VLLTLLGNADYEAEHVAVSPDGNRAVASCRDKTIKLWDIRPKALDLFKERSPKLILRGHTECINGIALSPEGRRVASASSDFTLKVWDLDAGHPLATIPLECKVLSCAWSIFGTIIAGDSDGKLHIVDFK
jgi:WD40 repeat protein